MDFFMRLPRNKKEFTLFIAIISVVSVNIIAPLITCFEVGFSFAVWKDVLTVIPFIWVAVVVLVLLTYKPAEWLTSKILKKEDSFNAYMIVNALCTVFMLSILLTVIGSWIGTRSLTLEPIVHFFYKWPRNFAIAFAIESVIAQPLARHIMFRMHLIMDKKKENKTAPAENV